MKPLRPYFPGDLCHTWHCGNLAHPRTQFCTSCIPLPRSPSFTIICIRFMLRQVLKLFRIE